MKGLAIIICMWSVLMSLSADESDCLCGTVPSDPDYVEAVLLLKSSIEDTSFLLGRVVSPSVASGFYPSSDLREDLDDPYPFEGSIYWAVISKWNLSGTEVPSKIKREFSLEPYDAGPSGRGYRKKVFKFNKNYAAIPQAFTLLKRDIETLYEKNESFLKARINDLSNKIPVYEWHILIERLTNKKTLLEEKKQEKRICTEHLNFINKKEKQAFAFCKESLDFCIAHHDSPQAYVHRGLFDYLEGNSLDALRCVKAGLQKITNTDLKKLQQEALALKGQTEMEVGLYADAVITLSDLIQRDPQNKGVYFDRAGAYFELGDFDLSMKDYLTADIKFEPITNDIQTVAFALGLTKGVVQGALEASTEFIPSVLSSFEGIGHGLWAFASDPAQMSKEFVQASQECIEFIRTHTPQDTLLQLAPELKDLIEQWDTFKNAKRGEMTGLIIGKYGVDIFAGVGVNKMMQSYRALKRANNLMTFQAVAISERNSTLIKLEAGRRARVRREILRNGNLQIQADKQGKHISGHRNYNLIKNKSILEHPDPQRLVNEFAGKGMREMNLLPGSPGYQEIVDFGEFIGYAVVREGGEKIPTTWGKIHYAKDGVHIVPNLGMR